MIKGEFRAHNSKIAVPILTKIKIRPISAKLPQTKFDFNQTMWVV